MQLRMLFLLIMLDCPPGQSFHSTANFRIHASVTFLISSEERPLLMGCFLEHLEMYFFRRTRFHAISRLGCAFPRTRNIFTNGVLIPKIYLAYSFGDAIPSWETLEKLFYLVSFAHAEHFLQQICIFVFCACTLHPKVASVRSGTKALATLWKNRKDCVCLLLFLHE